MIRYNPVNNKICCAVQVPNSVGILKGIIDQDISLYYVLSYQTRGLRRQLEDNYFLLLEYFTRLERFLQQCKLINPMYLLVSMHVQSIPIYNNQNHLPQTTHPNISSDLLPNPSTMEADYLIVGGGLCGCVLASRLHEANPSLRIILIEAGPDSRDNPNINHGGVIVARPEQMNWAYLTTEQRNLEGRRYPLTAGKVLGGGTALNAAAWTRGGRGDYDHVRGVSVLLLFCFLGRSCSGFGESSWFLLLEI